MNTTIAARPAPPAHLLRGASLFLDFDGTLVDLAPRPDAVIVGESLRALLRRLDRALEGRMAIVSGRSVAQLEAFLGTDMPAASGSHGVELRRADGSAQAVVTPPWLADAVARMQAFGRDRPGVVVEVKPYGVALHYRQVPEAEAACRSLAETLAHTGDVHIQEGKMMVELRAAGADKGDAVRAFMADPAMAGTRPVFIGDDLTDEPAFAAAAALGGAGILVGAERESVARYSLADVPATLAWLNAAAGELS